MGGDRRDLEYPVIRSEEETAVSNTNKAEIMAKSFAKSTENLTEKRKQ